jgi:serine/threonine protein kinase/Flp pilus assembly protein TadD
MPAPPSSETTGRTLGSWEQEPDDAEPLRGSGSAWISHQVQAMAAAWARGERIKVEEILERYPDLKTEHAVRLVYEDLCLRREAGEDVTTTEVVSRFPQWKDELELLLDCDRLLGPLSRSAILPEVGEQLGPFRLLAELGRGASGKTYLAAEPALADRLVVLKIIPDDQEEHLSLARLQHTHIIPLFSEQTFPDRGLRALCMPYLGGTSLARVLEALAEIPHHQRRGRHLLDVLDKVQRGRPAPPTAGDGPYHKYLDQASYVHAICWIAACLADGLHEAHVHGLVHMDVKPSNVLIAGDGQPMLLDFHLARKPIKAGERISDRLGGTPGWMAPEQEAALKAVGLAQPVSAPVDHRADLYALGFLLSEALGGSGAGVRDVEGKLYHRRNPEISVGLTDIALKCLATKPAERYRDAASLADDLRRHLNDLPLRGVANRSLTERWRKWRRRQPSALARSIAGSLTLAAVISAGYLAYLVRDQRARDLQAALEDGKKYAGRRQFSEAADILRRGLERKPRILTGNSLANKLQRELRLAVRGQKAEQLHHFADLVRLRHGFTPPRGEEAWKFIHDGRAMWEGRERLLNSEAGALDPEVEQRIRTDLLELAVVWADLRVRLASKADVNEARREAIRVLDQAEAACGPSPSLNRERRAYARALGQLVSSSGPDPAPQSAWEHYDLGRSYLRSGLFQEAATEFRRTLELEPQDFWSNYYQGHCAYHLGQFEDASAAFRTCIALSPKAAWCYHDRARAEEILGQVKQAFNDYSRAIELDPALAAAALNRGILSYKAGRSEDAIADFQRALRASPDPETAGRIHYNLALAHLARGDRKAALASAEESVASGYQKARDFRDGLRRKP